MKLFSAEQTSGGGVGGRIGRCREGTSGKADSAVMSINAIIQREHPRSLDNATLKNDPCGLVASLNSVKFPIFFYFQSLFRSLSVTISKVFHPLSVLDTVSHSDCVIGFSLLSLHASQLG